MLLALKPPNPMQNDIKPPHDYSTFKPAPSRYSPPESPRNLPSMFEDRMSNPHRGLPIPPGLNLPPPDRGSSTAPTLGHLPAPPAQWAGQDDSMRSWLHAKAEEDRRKQEEERTRQEGLRLDQRRIEERMLRDSLQGGIPPPMVPLIFAGIGGGNLPSHTLEWAQQYLASLSIQNQQQQQQIQQQHQQLQAQQQQPSVPPPQQSPDMRRDNRMIPPNPYGPQQTAQPTQSSPQVPSQSSSQSQIRPLPSSAQPQPPPPQTLSRLNTTDFVPSTAAARPPMHPLQQSQSSSDQQTTSGANSAGGPGLFFHHWTPPNPNNPSSIQPPTPSGKSAQGSPFSQVQQSHLRADYQQSPKKRKAPGGHPVSAQPTSQPHDTSPTYSANSSREREQDRDSSPATRQRRHDRQHSEGSSESTTGRHIARPSSRQMRLEGMSGPSQQQQHPGPLRQESSSGSSEHDGGGRYDERGYTAGGGGGGGETR